jgi:hypothetical protein
LLAWLVPVLALVAPAQAAPSAAPSLGSYTTNGPVYAITHFGDRTYIGGDFTRIGRRSGSGAVLSTDGTPLAFSDATGGDPAREVAGGDVRVAISDEAGGWYIGGDFTAVGGSRHVGLAHMTAEGAPDDTFNPAVTKASGDPATVNALVLGRPGADGKRTLYVGGEFARIGVGNTQFRSNVAALDAQTGQTKSFALVTGCSPTPCSPAVHALALTYVRLKVNDGEADQPVLLLGGDFTLVGTDPLISAVGLAAAWGVGSVDSTGAKNAGELLKQTQGNNTASWVPPLATRSPSSQVAAVYALQAGPPQAKPSTGNPSTVSLAVYVGGWNGTSGTSSRFPMARAYELKLDWGSHELAPNWQSDLTPQLPRWKPTPGAPADCMDCAVRALALQGGYVYFGGDFTTVGDPATAAHLGKVEKVADGETDPGFDPDLSSRYWRGTPLGTDSIDGPVQSLAVSNASDSPLFVGGDFGARLLALDPASGAPSPSWTTPAPDMPVRALAASSAGSSLYAGGAFRSLHSVVRSGLAAFDGSGSLLDWASGTGFARDSGDPALIDSLAASDSAVYVGGRFDKTVDRNGTRQDRINLAALDAASGDPSTSFRADATGSGANAQVLSLSLFGSTLYVGGQFGQLGGKDRQNLAAVDLGTGAVSGWAPAAAGTDSQVYAVLPACGAVYVGGYFSNLGGQARENLGAIDAETGVATPWRADANGAVLALARSGPTLYAGGNFAQIGGVARQKVGALNIADGHVGDFDAAIAATDTGTSVRALAATDSALYIGGSFLSLRGVSRSNLASVDPETGAPTAWDPAADASVRALGIVGDSLYAGGTFGALGTSGQRGLASFGPGAGSSPTSASCGSSGGSGRSVTELSPAGTLPPLTPHRTSTSQRRTQSQVRNATVQPRIVRLSGPPLTVRFTLLRAGRVRLRFERAVPARCAGPASRRRACTRYKHFVDVLMAGRRGSNRVRFPGQRVGRWRLTPGRYRVQISLVSARSSTEMSPRLTFLVRAAR